MSFSLFSHPRLCLLVVLLVTVSVVNGSKTYNIRRFGAVQGGQIDSSQALLSAWGQACKVSGGTVKIPRGVFLLNPVTLSGPCAGAITFYIRGVLKAPAQTFLDRSQWILFTELQGLTVSGYGVFDGQGAYAWSVNPCKVNPYCNPLPANIKFSKVTNGYIEGITSQDSKFFHIIVDNSQNIGFENIRITAPADSQNTDGIHIGRSNNVQAHNLNIGTGDDCISFGPGSTNVNISQVNCGPGHGISIGSLGKYENEEDVSGITVRNCTFTNTSNGLRIKTWAPSPPSKLSNVFYQDIIFNNVQNPIIIDQHYCPNNKCQHQGESQVQISNVKYSNIYGSSAEQMSVSFICSKKVPCQGIEVESVNIDYASHQPTTAACSFFNGQFSGCTSPNHCG